MKENIVTAIHTLDNIDQDICVMDKRLILNRKEHYLQIAKEMVAKYTGVVVTEDSLPDFKSTATYLKGKAKASTDNEIFIQVNINIKNPSDDMRESLKKIRAFVSEKGIGTFTIKTGKL